MGGAVRTSTFWLVGINTSQSTSTGLKERVRKRVFPHVPDMLVVHERTIVYLVRFVPRPLRLWGASRWYAPQKSELVA